mmetsp:Transcript_30724/g.81724  ORF Transcript_30724/g.81724 Transcript_30724/m.81724 type:complete len:99 (+) Transcript_30724:226-522(+)
MAKARGVTVFTALLAAAILACGDEAADGEVGGGGSSSCPAQEACEAPSPPFVGDIGIRYVGSVYTGPQIPWARGTIHLFVWNTPSVCSHLRTILWTHL